MNPPILCPCGTLCAECLRGAIKDLGVKDGIFDYLIFHTPLGWLYELNPTVWKEYDNVADFLRELDE